MTDSEVVEIVRLGAQGDGIAEGPDGPVYVQFALAGETVRILRDGNRGSIEELLTASKDRISPICSHFGKCGGCALQHLDSGALDNWKKGVVEQAMRSRGLEVSVNDVVRPDGLRRRATLTARKKDGEINFGFHAAASNVVIDIKECPILEVNLQSTLPRLRELASYLLTTLNETEARCSVTQTATGLDINFECAKVRITAAVSVELAKYAGRLDAARVTLNGDPVFLARRPEVEVSAGRIPLPPNTFLQAVREAESWMADQIRKGLGKPKNSVDLFCGVGVFSLAAANNSKVTAIDSDGPAIDALAEATRNMQGLKPVKPLKRDLFREPLSRLELNEFDAAIIDPPRVGAEAQARNLARSKIRTIISISCNPATFARDARILIDGGYTLATLTPVDQFRFSPHVELIAVFKRD